ncbi:MAG: flagellar basal body rod protein FlgC [Luminiphilus sp.]
MSLFDVMTIASTSLTAQTSKINTIAQNMANANTVASSPEATYTAQAPLFKAVLDGQIDPNDASQLGVRVEDIIEVGGPARQEFNPAHPLADDDGYIYKPDIDAATEMAEMMEASRSFQNSVEAINTAKQLALRTLTLGK